MVKRERATEVIDTTRHDMDPEMLDVNHPDHYRGTICPNCAAEIVDAADVFDQWTTDPHLWNALKYIQRTDRKLGQAGLKELGKAIWYLVRAFRARGGRLADVVDVKERRER